MANDDKEAAGTEKGGASVDPQSLSRLIKQRGPAPVHLWDPPYCGEMDMRITSDGTWIHEGRPIRRAALVRLFSSVLKKEQGRHYLVTPVEKIGIEVEDCPFVAQVADISGEGRDQQITLHLNTDEQVTIDTDHPLQVDTPGADAEPHPTVIVRNDLRALLVRNVFYQLVEIAVEDPDGKPGVIGVWSSGHYFPLGNTDPSGQA